jgi:hypothetical protein
MTGAARAPNWWSDGVTLPARRSCEDRLHTCARPVGARTWFRATLSCSSNRRCYQISFPGQSVFERKPVPDSIRDGCRFASRKRVSSRMARTPVIETGPSEWRSETRPSSYIRMVGSGENRTSGPQGDGVYSAATAPAVLKGTSRMCARVRAELAEGEGVEPSTFPSAWFSGPVARHRAPPSLTCDWPSRGGSNTRPHGSEPCALSI